MRIIANIVFGNSGVDLLLLEKAAFAIMHCLRDTAVLRAHCRAGSEACIGLPSLNIVEMLVS